MDTVSIESSTRKLQLLAMGALIEHARAGVGREDGRVRLLQRIAEMGAKLERDPLAALSEDFRLLETLQQGNGPLA